MAQPTYSTDGKTTSYTLISNISSGNAGMFNSVDSITLTNVGANYNYAPQIIISGGGGVGAKANAYLDMANGTLSGINVYTSGSGYLSVPTITITGGNPRTPATAVATLTGGWVTTVTMSEFGSRYQDNGTTVVTFSAPQVAGGVTATGHALINGINGSITNIIIDNRGSGYTEPPTVTITSTQGGTGAVVGYVAVSSVGVGNITLTSTGNGYSSVPTIGIVPTQNTQQYPVVGAGAIASVGYPLANITVTDQGTGYVTIPDVHIRDANTGSLGAILIANSGAGYSNTPTINISSPNQPHGQQASANAVLAQNSIASVIIGDYGTGYTSPPTIQVSAAQNNYPTYSANLVAVLNTGVNGAATANLLPYYTGNAVQGGSYYLRTNPFQTFMTNAAANFVGNVYVQATLSTNPEETDWFDVKKLNVVANTVSSETITGKFYWVRARIEDFKQGTINSITVTYPYNS